MPMQLLSEEFRAEFTPFDSAPFGKPHERYDAAPHPTREVFCRSFEDFEKRFKIEAFRI